jgi:hypothetical protein
MEIIVFDDEESATIDSIVKALGKKQKELEIENINKHMYALLELGRAISQYPSILQTNIEGSQYKSLDNLLEMLCRDATIDEITNIPTKAVLGKGFLIAKVNFFYYLHYIAETIEELHKKIDTINNYVYNIIFTLMGEEVFISLIEDTHSSEIIRNRAGFLLANIWEYRLNQSVKKFAPILTSIWEARNKITPVFGTMLGFSELLAISGHIDPIWMEFLQHEKESEDKYQSIEEFLFAFSYEELTIIRQEMQKRGIQSLSRKELDEIIGEKKIYPDSDPTDAKKMYHFFRSRTVNAWFRRRAGAEGPKKTIEQHLMGFLLQQAEWPVQL